MSTRPPKEDLGESLSSETSKTKKPRLDTFIKLYQEITRLTFSEKQTAQIKKQVMNKCRELHLLNSQEMAELVHASVRKVMRPKHVRFAPVSATPELFSEAQNHILFKMPLSKLMDLKTSVSNVILPGTTITGQYHIEVDSKGTRTGYVKINGQIDKARITTNATGKILSIEEFDMGKEISIKTFYPSGALKIYSYLNKLNNALIEISYYDCVHENKIKSLTTFRNINGYYIHPDNYKEFDESGHEKTCVTPTLSK